MEKPLVSVLMTCWNREKYIGAAIESVLASTFENFELIICDDCSSDNSYAIAEGYAAKDSRIKVYRNEKNLGDYPNRNRAASWAKGKYLMYVDSDDMILKDGIEKCMNCFLQFPEARFATYYRIGGDKPFVLDSAVALREHFFKENYLMIGPGGTVIEKQYFNSINGFPEKYGPANDTYYNLKAASQSPVLLIPFEFYYYRRHEDQEFNNSFSYLYNNYRYTNDALKELNLHLSKDQVEWLDKKNKRRFLINLYKHLKQTKNAARVLEAIKKANFTFADACKGAFHFYTKKQTNKICQS